MLAYTAHSIKLGPLPPRAHSFIPHNSCAKYAQDYRKDTVELDLPELSQEKNQQGRKHASI